MEKPSSSSTNTCKSMVTTTRLPPPSNNSQLAYFFNISIKNKKLHDPLANLRIKIPKLLAKTVKKNHQPNNNKVSGGGGNGGNDSSSNTNSKGRTMKRRVKTLLSGVVGGVKKSGTPAFSDAFADFKKSKATTTFDSHDDGNTDIRNREKSLAFHFNQNEFDDLESLSSESLSSKSDHLNSDLEYFATKSPLWDDAKQMINKEQICKICRQRFISEVDGKEMNFLKGVPPSSPPFSFLGFPDNKSTPPPPSSKNLMHTNSISSKDCISSIYSESESSESDLSFRKDNYYEQKEISGMTDEKEHHDDEEDENKELWRKKILLGERCQPLNFSGCIQYDEYGNLM